MREIKFRIWDEQLERFIFFGLFGYPFDDMGEEYVKQNAEQYTGLKDKNGVDIYEGDVGRHQDGRIIYIHYNASMKLLTAHYEDDPENENPTYTFAWQYIKIIGNIHEVLNEQD